MPKNKFIHYLSLITISVAIFSASLSARTLYDREDRKKFDNSARSADGVPADCVVQHRVGNIALALSNNGTLGTKYAVVAAIDCFTNRSVSFGCEVPKNTGVEYIYGGAFWIGALVGRDTLVSVGHDGWNSVQEFSPDPPSPDSSISGEMIKKSIIDPNDFDLYEGAISEEDYIAQYTDTVTRAGFNPTPDPRDGVFKPIGVEVIQKSFAWSYEYAEDFVLFDYAIQNIGVGALRDVYMGVYVDADVGATPMPYEDDLCGFIPEFLDTHLTCEFVDLANIAWIADNDGDMSGSTAPPARHVTGTRIVRTPAESLEISFNWWKGDSPDQDFGPREQSEKGKWKETFRDFGTGGLGTPDGNRNKYYQLRNQEFDYDQAYTCVITNQDSLWLLPNQTLACGFADGGDTRYLLSFGPFNIDPGEVLPLSFAYVAGMNLHVDQDNARRNLPNNPGAFYDGLDFKDLQVNARWAEWIYDNPGVDTDSDGYAGIMRFCNQDSIITGYDTIVDTTVIPPDTIISPIILYTVVDTSFAQGDGVPDFRGASPPPAPKLFIEPNIGEIKIRFNGYRSETTKDPFSRSVDFEGYSIYVARDDRSSSYAKVVSYDRENFNKWTYNTRAVPPIFQLKDEPFSYDELFSLYAFGDSAFDPLRYTVNRPYRHPNYPESTFYFERQGFNASSLTDPTGIRKVYPSQPYPSSLDLDTLRLQYPSELTPDGLPKYFEYTYTVTRLLPTVAYWISVTAFDFGSPSSGLPSLETNVTQNTADAYPLETYAAVDSLNRKVFVYPNPYRIDANYRARGFEGVDPTGHRLTQSERPDDRARLIHFANVPAKSVISIFSLDGDLVREIIHDMHPAYDSDTTNNGDPINPNASHATWDLITRNTQAAVSGLYYWTVENKITGEIQMGKLVIIM